MDADFWKQRWEENRIGFHLDEVNPYLQRQWPGFSIPTGANIFVPLCGKSQDLVWLAQTHQVIGVELSPIAVEAVFAGNPSTARERVGELERWQAGNLTVYCGDFFHLEPAMLGSVDFIYDRAALIALPADMRARYVAHLMALCGRQPGMLVSLDYDQSKLDGPPFSVSHDEVLGLYQPDFRLQVLEEHEVLYENARFRQRGLTSLVERVYYLNPYQ